MLGDLVQLGRLIVRATYEQNAQPLRLGILRVNAHDAGGIASRRVMVLRPFLGVMVLRPFLGVMVLRPFLGVMVLRPFLGVMVLRPFLGVTTMVFPGLDGSVSLELLPVAESPSRGWSLVGQRNR